LFFFFLWGLLWAWGFFVAVFFVLVGVRGGGFRVGGDLFFYLFGLVGDEKMFLGCVLLFFFLLFQGLVNIFVLGVALGLVGEFGVMCFVCIFWLVLGFGCCFVLCCWVGWVGVFFWCSCFFLGAAP
ncbi:hypothetical protein, partial [Streptomyces sp. BE20]|uniref:hypothetical protein n=1 Tax=Streptomyces sp. BE20 TaxID=3002525 RepID=UPI002E77121E